MKIAIIGYGYVGKAMYELFKDHYDMCVYDPAFKHVPHITEDKDEINSCDLGVICVPTPRGENGECDISIVNSVMEWLDTPLILLKSTVEIGTTRQICNQYAKNIVFSPEYCGESSYWTPYDFHTEIVETPFFIFGGFPEDISKMVDIFMPVCGPTKKYVQCRFEEAELAKYMENSFYATKIAFCYEMYEICHETGIDWNTVRELWLLDPRINPMHTSVFHENDYPFSGKCLPKDTSALAKFAEKMEYDANLLKEVLKTNERIRTIRADRRRGTGQGN
jgi:nucleotide sugar dehydrogenase